MYRSILLLIFFTNPAFAAAPDGVNHQGYLQNLDGTALNGTVDIRFAIWDSPVSVNPISLLFSEDHDDTEVLNGLFSVELGAGVVTVGRFDANLFAQNDRWLETIVNGERLSPRTKFLSVPYALQARQADEISGMTGAVMHFLLPQCPAGWSELPAARGRTLVGLPANGTLSGTSGSALTNLESRQHNHTVSTPAVSTSTAPAHTHIVPSAATTSDSHNHIWSRWNGTLNDWTSFNSGGSEFTITNWSDGMDQAGSGIYPIAASTSGTTTIYTNTDNHSHATPSISTASNGAHSHTAAGTVTSSSPANSAPTLPYLQLLVCVKN